jgi:hypothetical protein
MIKLNLFLFLLFIPFQLVYAEDIEMFVDQSAYYFKVGDDAVIPLEIHNNFGHQISGMLQYTITQQIKQGNTQFSSTNTQATIFSINEGKQTVSLDFGTSNSPTTLIVNLNFNYNIGNEMNVSLDPIEIHFVTDESQKNNTQNRMQSSSQQSSPSQNNQPNPQQSLQQKLNNLLNQSPLIQNPQQRLQNNQLSQDSNALKQEIQQQLQDENKLKQEFAKQLASNEDFQKLHQQILQQGYNVTSNNLYPNSTSTGNFEINYQNEQGKWAKIQGSMINGTLTDIQKQTQEEKDNLLSKLRQDPTFQGYESQLTNEGFTEQNIEYASEKNMTSILLKYQNNKIKTASIKADFKNNELIKVQLEKPGTDYSNLFPLVAILPLSIMAYILYKKLKTKKKILTNPIISKKTESFDYVKISKNLIQEAKNDFKEKNYKNAYGKAAQAIRIFLSYDLNLNKEITNEEILLFLNNAKYPKTDIENCFKFSSLVEFAKQETNENEFNKIINTAEILIHGKFNHAEKDQENL